MAETTDYNVRAVERALMILKSFDDQHTERGLSEIAEAVGLHKATAHRIIATMIGFGFIERSTDGQKYRLGLQLFELGYKVSQRMDLRREAFPYMTHLAEQINEAVDLSIWYQSQVLYVEMIESQQTLTISATVGQRLPAYCTAGGKVFLAHLGEEELSEYLKNPIRPRTPNTITNPDELRGLLKSVRENGYAVDNEECDQGVKAIAAPIYNQQRKIVGAVSIPIPSNRLTQERLLQILPILMQTTRDISHRLGWFKA